MTLTPQQVSQMDSIFGAGQSAPPAGSLTPSQVSQLDGIFGMKPSLGQRLGSDFQNYQEQANQAAKNPSLIDSMAQGANAAANLGLNALGEVTPNAVKDVMGWVGKKALEGAQHIPGMQSYSEAWQQQPQTAQDVENAAFNVANLVGAGEGLAGGAKLLRNGVNAASDSAAGIGASPSETALKPLNNPKNITISKDEPNAVSSAIDEERQKAFTAAANSGAARTPEAVNGFLNNAINNDAFHPDTFTAASDKSALNLANQLGEELNGQPMSIKRAQALDQDLATLKNGAFKKPDAPNQRLGYQYAAIQQALRDHVFNNPDASTYIGNPEGWNALNEGNRLHSQYIKAKTIENLYQNGAEKAVPSTSIQTQFGQLAKKIRESGKGQLGYTSEQVAAINRAAKTGVAEPLLRTMGSKLMGPLLGIVAGAPSGPIGEFIGMGAGHMMGEPFRMGATALRTGKAADVLRAVVNDPYYNKLPSE